MNYRPHESKLLIRAIKRKSEHCAFSWLLQFQILFGHHHVFTDVFEHIFDHVGVAPVTKSCQISFLDLKYMNVMFSMRILNRQVKTPCGYLGNVYSRILFFAVSNRLKGLTNTLTYSLLWFILITSCSHVQCYEIKSFLIFAKMFWVTLAQK